MLRSCSAFRSSSGALQFGVPTSHDSTVVAAAASEDVDRTDAASKDARARRAVVSAGAAAAMDSVSRLCPKSPIYKTHHTVR